MMRKVGNFLKRMTFLIVIYCKSFKIQDLQKALCTVTRSVDQTLNQDKNEFREHKVFMQVVGSYVKLILEFLPESEGFDFVDAVEDFDTVDWVVVILVVEQDALLDDDLLGRVTNVNHAEEAVRQMHFLEGRE
jgi:hypothetical protein